METARARVQPRAAARRRLLDAGATAVLYVLASAGAFFFVLPFVWMVSTSLKDQKHVYTLPIEWIPRTIVWENYTTAWFGRIPFTLYTLNTLVITLSALVGTLLSASLVAYGFARLRFPGRDVLFLLVLGMLMIPFQVVMIPTYVLFKNLGWLDTWLPLIVPAWFGGGAFNIFLLRQFFRTIPFELEDAARIDGCGYLGTWGRIIMPLSGPALAAVAIFNFVWHWNAFIEPLIYLRDENKFTISLGLQMFQRVLGDPVSGKTQSLFDAQYIMAASAIVLVPIIVLFFFTQKYFIQGIVMTGMKG
jgi:ABC-type glycerol-3-phosphate transport system permease component